MVKDILRDFGKSKKNIEYVINNIELICYSDKNNMVQLLMRSKNKEFKCFKGFNISIANMSKESNEGTYQGSLDVEPFIKALTDEICARFNRG